MTDRAALADRFRHAASVWKGTCLAKVDVSAEVCDLDVIADALEAKPNAMTPAQDATALADRLSASIGPYHINEFERRQIVAALRATSQTPDAVLEAAADAIDAARYAHPDHPRERPRSFAEADRSDREYAVRLARAALRSAPSASAGLQAIDWTKPIETRETSPRHAKYLGPVEGGTIDYVLVSIGDGDSSFHHPAGEYRALKDTGFIRGKLALRNVASAGPQAEAVKESLHYLWAIKVRLQLLYEQSTQDSRLLEHLSDEVDWIDAEIGRLRAHPQPQQADGRGAVIEALKHFGRHDDDCAVKKPPFKCSCGFHAALQQSPATDGPAK